MPAAALLEDLDVDLEAIANKHGWPKVVEAVRRLAEKT